MIIDCHYHLEERVYPVDRLLSEMQKTGIDKVALMGSMIEPFREPPAFLIRVLQVFLENRLLRGIGRALVSSFTDRGEIRILGRPYPIERDPDNAKVFDAAGKHPDRFLGWIFVNPRGGRDQMDEYERFRESTGFIGVKAHPFWHRFRPVELLPVAERLAKTGRPLLLHLGFGEEGDFEALLAKVPDLRLVLAHAGFPAYADTWEKIRDRKNVYLDLSQTSYTSERATRQAVECLGPDRVFFGTDGPYGFHSPDRSYDYGYLKRRVERMFPDAGIRERILGGNFAGVTGLR